MIRKFLLSYGLFGLLILSACNSADGAVPAPVSSATPQTAVKSLPTSISPGKRIVYDDLQVAMSQAEITTSYLTEYGSTREPSVGGKFLWIHVLLKNVGQREQNLPAPEHFSVLYDATEFKSTYGHRKGYVDYTTLKPVLYQGEEADAWLRFDIPIEAELKDLQFVFLPESSQVSVGFSSSDYSWGNHPIYLWMCAP